MTVFRTAVVAALLAAPVFSGVVIGGQDAPTYQERDFLTPRPPPDRRRQARRRRLLVARRQAPRVSERARAGQSLLSDLRARSATGDTKRISPGTGKTTCAFFRPGTDEIEFASTHADPKSKQYQDDELAFRASGKERRYSWDYDPEMDIYATARRPAR